MNIWLDARFYLQKYANVNEAFWKQRFYVLKLFLSRIHIDLFFYVDIASSFP